MRLPVQRLRALLVVAVVLVTAGCVTVVPPATVGPSPFATAPTTAVPATSSPSIPTLPPTPPATAPPATPVSSVEPSVAPTPSSPGVSEPPLESPPPADDVIFSDDFSGTLRYLSSGLQEGFGGSEYVDGVYRVTAQPQPGFVNYQGGGSTEGCSGTDCSFPDVINNTLLTSHVEVDAKLISGSTAGSFGIACAYEGTGVLGRFIGLTISADGRRWAVALNSAVGDTPVDQLKGGADRGEVSAAINQGVGATNHLRADCGDQSFSFWVNDHLVTTAQLDEPLGVPSYQRGVGLVAAPAADEQVVVEFDNLVVSEQIDEPVVTPEAGVTVFADAMDQPTSTWPTGEFQYATSEFADGAYRVTMTESEFVAPIVPVSMYPPTDVGVQVDVTLPTADLEVSAGVLCRVSSSGWYAFEIRGDGKYSILRSDGNKLEPIVGWTASDAIVPGINTVGLDCVDGMQNGYVNGTLVATGLDSTLDSGQFGLQVSSGGHVGDESAVDFTQFLARHASN